MTSNTENVKYSRSDSSSDQLNDPRNPGAPGMPGGNPGLADPGHREPGGRSEGSRATPVPHELILPAPGNGKAERSNDEPKSTTETLDVDLASQFQDAAALDRWSSEGGSF